MTTDTIRALEATRHDATNGTVESIGFRGQQGSRVFTCLYRPASRPRGAVLICPPLHAEFTRNYRREVLLARRLAHEGFLVERFHYRGTGNSDGEGNEVTFETMREDAAAALELLRTESGVGPTFLIGTRWGALVAGSAAASLPTASLVLWEPLLAGSRFFRDGFRTRMVAELKSGVEQPATGEELTRRLRAGETVDVVGYSIEKGLYESSVDRTLGAELGPTPRSMLLIQIGPSSTVRPELAREAQRWRAAGFGLDVQTVQGDEMWWLVEERWSDEGIRSVTNQLVESTTAWVVARTADRAAAEVPS